MFSDAVPLLIAGALSILPPIIFVGIRHSVKIKRQEIVRDLSKIFASKDSSDESLIPSFEFVKYKYFLDRETRDDNRDLPRDHSPFSWIMGGLPLVLLLFFLSYIVVSVIWPLVVLRILGQCPALAVICATPASAPIWIWSLCAAFAGGYVFMIRSFYRAINNFDLSPLSFAGACSNLFVGVVGAEILSLAIAIPATGVGKVETAATVTAVILSFAVGYFPEPATRAILWRSDLTNFKRENTEIYKSSLATPIEIIDGIDTEIRDRLADYHIRSTQNLAAANPLMLFVETPFGVYQIMDWVAQAQLCSSVGPENLTKLWRVGVRTLFDLERIALDPACYSPALLESVGPILFSRATGSTDANAASIDEAAVVANISLRLEDPHVHRLRQIYNRIGERLNNDNRRLKFYRARPLSQGAGGQDATRGAEDTTDRS